MSVKSKSLQISLTALLLLSGPLYAQDMGDMGFTLDLGAASGDEKKDDNSAGDAGFSLDLNAAPADNGSGEAANGDAGFSINLDGSGDGEFVIDFGGDVDFGDMTFDFGTGTDDSMDFGSLDMSSISEMKSEEKEHYEEALKLARNERWEQAAAKFAFILSDEAHKEFWLESEFQLAKALYKMELYHPAMERFKVILNKGPKHPRFKTSVEFVFYISRKMVDQNEVLQELAKFRKIPWPKQYRNEYRLLLAKYLFLQAQVFEQNRMKAEEAAIKAKKSQKHFDFKEFEEDNSNDDGWGETFVFGGDEEDEDSMDFEMGDFNMDEGFTMEFEDENEMKAETAPLPTNAADAINLALEMLAQISEKSRFSPQARYLEGLLHYLAANGQKGESLDKSVKAFTAVTKALDPKTAKITDPVLREAAFLTLARIYYEFQRFDVSVYYYDKIDRDSEMWLTALFESSWAYFQRGDFEKALGNLATLHSPFFKEEYFPESQNLKAVIYLENCRYPETRKIANDFANEMKPVLNHLKPYVKEVKQKDGTITQPPTADKLYEQIDTMLSSKKRRSGDELTMKVMRLVTMDPDVALSREKVAEINKQLALLDKRSGDFKQSAVYVSLQEELTKMREARVLEGGRLLAARFEEEISTLSGLISQAIQIRKQVASSLKEIKVKQMHGEDIGVTQRAYELSVAVDDEYLYWPYEEEYWRDELGTYEYTLSWGCK